MTDPTLCPHANTVRIPTPDHLPWMEKSTGHIRVGPDIRTVGHPLMIHRCLDCDLRGELVTQATKLDTGFPPSGVIDNPSACSAGIRDVEYLFCDPGGGNTTP